MEENLEAHNKGESQVNDAAKTHPIAAFHPGMGMLEVDQFYDKEELSTGLELQKVLQKLGEDAVMRADDEKIVLEEDEEAELIPEDHQLVVHGPEGKYLMEKAKWPILKLSTKKSGVEEPVEGLTQEDSLVSQDISMLGRRNKTQNQGVDFLNMGVDESNLNKQKACNEEYMTDNISIQS